MKKVFIFSIIFILSVSFLSAIDSPVMNEPQEDRTLVLAQATDFEDVDTLMNYWFIASYNLMLQDKGQGGILAFDGETMEYIAGYRMANTPEDFFLKLPASTLTSPVFMPALVARAIFMSVNDRDSLSRIAYLDDDEAVMMVSVLKLYDNEKVVLEEAAYSLARQAIEGSFGASGLNIEPAYGVYERNGISRDDLVDLVLSGEKTPNELSLEAIRMMKTESESAPAFVRYLPVLFVLLGILGLVLAVLAVIIVRKTKKLK